MTEPKNSKRGIWLVSGIVGVAACLAVVSLWHRRNETWQATQLWGAQQAQLILSADKVEVLRLEPAPGSGDLQAAGTNLRIVSVKDVSRAPGFSHARNALVLDRNFDFAAPPDEAKCKPAWTCALRFTSETQQATVLLSLACQRAMLAGTNHSAQLRPDVAAAFQKLLEKP